MLHLQLLTLILLATACLKSGQFSADQVRGLEEKDLKYKELSQKCDSDSTLPKNQEKMLGDISDNLSCAGKCPQSFELLKRQPEPDPMNFLSFGNFHGHCRGMSQLVQKFGLLAVWDSKKNPQDPDCPKDQKMSTACYDFYRKKVEQINNYQVVEIPGFKNLAEFSAHPLIGKLLEDTAANYGTGFSVEGIAVAQDSDFVANVAKRIKQHQTPHINIRRGSSGHAIIGSGTKYIESLGQEVVCITDPNHSGETQCQNYLFMQNGKCLYQESSSTSTLGQYYITTEENAKTLMYVEARAEYCRSKHRQTGECI